MTFLHVLTQFTGEFFSSQYIIANLGMAQQFGTIAPNIDTVFPATMEVDYIRVYQYKDSINVGCDPTDFPTSAYIST